MCYCHPKTIHIRRPSPTPASRIALRADGPPTNGSTRRSPRCARVMTTTCIVQVNNVSGAESPSQNQSSESLRTYEIATGIIHFIFLGNQFLESTHAP